MIFLKTVKQFNKTFNDFSFPASSQGIFENSPSGYINPRLLIKAQLNLFRKNNGTVVDEIANEIEYEENCLQIETVNGNVYKAKKVLLCPGAFVNFFNLIKNKLALSLKGETTLWAKVTAKRSRSFIKASLIIV